jgi:8-oxo-dGTP diphosphatase
MANPDPTTPAPTAATILVAAGILVEGGRVLVTQRKAGAHLAGMWEFPGGKVGPGEDPKDALARELDEEIGVQVEVGRIVEATFHRYAEKSVLLLFYEVRRRAHSAEPVVRDVAALRWAGPNELDPRDFPPADIDVLGVVRATLGSAMRPAQ